MVIGQQERVWAPSLPGKEPVGYFEHTKARGPASYVAWMRLVAIAFLHCSEKECCVPPGNAANTCALLDEDVIFVGVPVKAELAFPLEIRSRSSFCV